MATDNHSTNAGNHNTNGRGAPMGATGTGADMEQYIVFRDSSGKELLSYTVRGTFPGELQATISLLAFERGIPEDQITATLEER